MLLPKGKELLNVLILNLPANFYSGRVQQSVSWLTNSPTLPAGPGKKPLFITVRLHRPYYQPLSGKNSMLY